jgi:drug/metabolite transporter (DMT)-like permease
MTLQQLVAIRPTIRAVTHPDSHVARGALFFLLGVFLFACMDTIIKYLAARYPAPLIVAVRYVIHCLLMVLVLAPSQGRKLLRTQRTGLVLFRAACLVTGSLLFALALQRLPVAEATAIIFVAPLLVVMMAGPLLKEHVGKAGWAAVVAGFIGILLIARPGGSLDGVGVALAFATALTTASYQLLSRLLAGTETTLAMLFYTALVGALVFGAIAPWFWGGARPEPLDLALFLGTGVLGGLGHFLFTAAHRHAAASTLAPMQYSQLVWVGLLGWLVFGHVPEAPSILGMCIVAAAGAAVAVRSRLAARALERASEA